jgi:hypothetical protein
MVMCFLLGVSIFLSIPCIIPNLSHVDFFPSVQIWYRLYGLVVQVLAIDPEFLGLIPGTTRFYEK